MCDLRHWKLKTTKHNQEHPGRLCTDTQGQTSPHFFVSSEKKRELSLPQHLVPSLEDTSSSGELLKHTFLVQGPQALGVPSTCPAPLPPKNPMGKKTIAKSTLGREGFIWLIYPNHSPSLREAEAGARAGQELKPTTPWRNATQWVCSCWLAQPASLHTSDVAPPSSWALPHQLLFMQMPNKHAHRAI